VAGNSHCQRNSVLAWGYLRVRAVREGDVTGAAGAILFVLDPDSGDLSLQGLHDRLRNHGPTVPPALAVADVQPLLLQVDVLDPQGQGLQDAQSAAIQKRRYKPRCAFELAQQVSDFVPGEHDGQPLGPLGVNHALDPAKRTLQHDLVEEQQGRQAWFCVEGLTLPPRANEVRNAATSASAMSRGWRLP